MIEHRFPRYMIFGKHKDGRVNIPSPIHDTIATVTRAHAETLINERDAIVDKLAEMAVRFSEVAPDEFDRFWYGAPTVDDDTLLLTTLRDGLYNKIDKGMKYRDDKRLIAVRDHRFRYISEMMYELFKAGFTPNEIGVYLDMTGVGVKYHLKRMGCDMNPHGGFRIVCSSTGIPGVHYRNKDRKFVAHIQIDHKRHSLGTHQTKLQAAFARRFGEIEYNYQLESKAQKYIDLKVDNVNVKV